MSELIKFARKCDECEKGMNSGFCINDGEAYYCSDECLHKHHTPAEWEEMYNGDEEDGEEGGGSSYWTEWEEEIDFHFVEIDGKLVDVDDIDEEE